MIQKLKWTDFKMNRIDFYNEIILRENVRKAIRLVQSKRQKNLTEETKLRNIIRTILNEEDSNTEGPSLNTGGNALDNMLLNTNTLSELETEFKTLTTSAEQRKSFRSHIINAAIKALGVERAAGLPNATEGGEDTGIAMGAESGLEELAEALNSLIETELAMGDDSEEEVEDEANGLDALKLGEEPEEADPLESEREEFGAGVGEMDKTGRNYALDAWNKVSKNVIEPYAKLGSEEDRKQYYDYLITNLKLYFDTWESELEGTPEEPTTPEYEQEKGAEAELGGEEEMGMEPALEDDLDFGSL
tara:strand:- start:2022 stop:2933 length:912 start_codon:yes stop_codon:yes gene_type:complete